MSDVDVSHSLAPVVPLPLNIRSAQPGGGKCYQIELAWGKFRRWRLKRFRPGYVRRMAELRQGSLDGAPHELLDPRDLKYCENLCDARWNEADDRFAWRGRLGFARWGLCELMILAGTSFSAAALTALAPRPYGFAAIAPAVVGLLIVYFFRDPKRPIPEGSGLIIAPADGTIAEIVELADDEFIGGPAVRIGVFLSIFNVHINRSPARARVIELRYSPGAFINALNPESAIKNENMWIGLQGADPPYRKMVVRQISGAIARRIVCTLRPGETIAAGEKFGMIKLGSRTEIILPLADGLHVAVKVGDKIRAGCDVVAQYCPAAE